MSVNVNFTPGTRQSSEFSYPTTHKDMLEGVIEFLETNPDVALVPLSALRSTSGRTQELVGRVVKYFLDAVSEDGGDDRRRVTLVDYSSGMSPSLFDQSNRWVVEYDEDEDPRDILLGVFGRNGVESDENSTDIVKYLEGTYSGRGLQVLSTPTGTVLDVLVEESVPEGVDPSLYDIDPFVRFELTEG